MSIFQLTEDHHGLLDRWDQLTSAFEVTQGENNPEVDPELLKILARNIEDSFQQQGISQETFREIVQHKTYPERQAELERSNLAAGIAPTPEEQVLQVFSDRLKKNGVEFDPAKLRIDYGINNCQNQTVVYGTLKSGKFRSNEISEAQATAILNAIGEPTSTKIEKTDRDNFRNARIHVTYDGEVVLRQERNGKNSINPLCQEQAQEHEAQASVISADAELLSDLSRSIDSDRVEDSSSQAQVNQDGLEVADANFNHLPSQASNPIENSVKEVQVNINHWESLLTNAATNGWSPRTEAALEELAVFPEVALHEQLKYGDLTSYEQVFYDEVLSTFERQKQHLKQCGLDTPDLCLIAPFRDWSIADVQQVYADTQEFGVKRAFDLLSDGYQTGHELDPGFDLNCLSDEESKLTVNEFALKEFYVRLTQIAPAYSPLSVEQYLQNWKQEQAENDQVIDPWELDSVRIETVTATPINNDLANLHPIEQEFIALYKDWSLQELRQAFESAQEYKSLLVGIISSDCETVLEVVATAYGKKHHPDREFNFSELPAQVFDTKVSEFVQQEFQVDLDQVRSASQLLHGGCSVEEYHQRCQEEKNNSPVLESESAITSTEIDYDRFAQTLEELFAEADQQSIETVSQHSQIGIPQHSSATFIADPEYIESDEEDVIDSDYLDPYDPLNDLSYEELSKEIEKARQEREKAEFSDLTSHSLPVAELPQEQIGLEPLTDHSPVQSQSETPETIDQSRPEPVDSSESRLLDWLESGDWNSDPQTATRVVSWAEWYKDNDGLNKPTSVLSPAAIAVSQMPESNSKQFVQTLITDLQNQPEQVAEQASSRAASQLEPEHRSFTPLAAALDQVAHRVVDRAVQWLDSKLVAVERGLEKVGKWWSSRAEAIQNHQSAEIAYRLFDRGFNRTEEPQYQHQGFQVEKIANEKNSSIFILRDAQTGNDLLKFRAEQQLHSAPKIEVLAKARGGIAPETIERLSDLESNLGNVRGSDRGEEQRNQNVERFAQVARLANEFGSTQHSHYVVDSGKTESGEDWLRVTAKGSRGVIYEQTGSEIREDLQLWDFRRANSAYATAENPVTASEQTSGQER